MTSTEVVIKPVDQAFLNGAKQKLSIDAGLANRDTQSYVPLLSHECLTSPYISESSEPISPDAEASQQNSHESGNGDAEESVLINECDDLTLEIFPSEATQILQKLATIYREGAEDGTVDDWSLKPRLSSTLSPRHSPAFTHECLMCLSSLSDPELETSKFQLCV